MPAKKTKAYYARRREQARRARLRKFEMTVADYENMLKAQNGECAICKRKPTKRRLAVDHCHKTGKVRGLLCYRCNYGLGFWQDEYALLEAAAQYLKP